jgi:peptidoglycan/LPS O-acetylase OafA/YrhL
MDESRKNPHLAALTGLRFLAAFLVFFCHATLEGILNDAATDEPLRRAALTAGWLGVEFFFILSGFVLTWSTSDEDTPGRFWRRRAVKIFPNHIVTWAVSVAFALLGGLAVSAPQLLPNLLLINVWVPDDRFLTPLNVPSWSLGCELLFYLLFPWLRRVIFAIRPARLWLVTGMVVAAIVAVPFAVYLLLPGTPRLQGFDMSLLQRWAVHAFPPVRALEFVLGMLVARIVMTGRWIPVSIRTSLLLLACCSLAQFALVRTAFGNTAPTALPLVFVIAAVAASELSGKTSILGGRALVRLGELSFAFYMVHYLVLQYGHAALGGGSWPAPAALGIIAFLLLVALCVSWLLYTSVELPAMRRWSRPRRPEAARQIPGRQDARV